MACIAALAIKAADEPTTPFSCILPAALLIIITTSC